MKRFTFAGRTCLITGAASGIGAALALDLAKRRTVLALLDVNAEGLERVAALARELGAAEVTTYVVDLSDGGDRLDLAAEIASRHGGGGLFFKKARVDLMGTVEQKRVSGFDWL